MINYNELIDKAIEENRYKGKGLLEDSSFTKEIFSKYMDDICNVIDTLKKTRFSYYNIAIYMDNESSYHSIELSLLKVRGINKLNMILYKDRFHKVGELDLGLVLYP